MGNKDYWAPGDWNITCSMCGGKYKASEVTKNWMGMYRCNRCQEPRQPQDFVGATEDRQTVPFAQPPEDDYILTCDFNGQSAFPDIAIPDCSIPDRTGLLDGTIVTIGITVDRTDITVDSTLITVDSG